MTAPLVSVVITAFDTGRYLPETLESVFAETHDRYEVIVVDDGSTDDTAARAREFGDRITFVSRPHVGLGPARNAGLARITGDYVAFLDSDDLWVPETLSTQLEVAARHPESAMVVADGLEFEAGRVVRPRLFGPAVAERVDVAPGRELTDRWYRHFMVGNRVNCPAQTLIPRRVVDELGEVCVTPNGAEDYDYYLRITRRYPVTFHGASLARWRFRAESMSGAMEERTLRWAGQGLEVLVREEASAPDEHRAFARACIAEQTRRGLRLARQARIDDRRVVAEDLARVYAARPADPVVVATRAALALPAPLDRSALRGLDGLAALRRGVQRRWR